MSNLYNNFSTVQNDKHLIIEKIYQNLDSDGYKIVELNDTKPWGGYLRLDSANADRFIRQFFPGLNAIEARLGQKNAELSPKILLVSPGQRLSWQYHNRRAEMWKFLSRGAYNKSFDDQPGALIEAKVDDVVHFECGERHRLVGLSDEYVVVAEIWQHVKSDHPSDEDDIVRLDDDYKR